MFSQLAYQLLLCFPSFVSLKSYDSSETSFWRVCNRDFHLQENVLSIVHETIGFSQQCLISELDVITTKGQQFWLVDIN